MKFFLLLYFINTRWMVTTKMQPTDARKAFPCFDEPKYKASFKLTVKHWKNFTAIANMPVEVKKKK